MVNGAGLEPATTGLKAKPPRGTATQFRPAKSMIYGDAFAVHRASKRQESRSDGASRANSLSPGTEPPLRRCVLRVPVDPREANGPEVDRRLSGRPCQILARLSTNPVYTPSVAKSPAPLFQAVQSEYRSVPRSPQSRNEIRNFHGELLPMGLLGITC